MSQCRLSWDSYQKNICHGFTHLQEHEEFVDMTLAADGHLVKVHRSLVALASPYIKAMLQTAPCPHPVVFLNNINHEILSYILQYIYSGEVNIPIDKIDAFKDAAKNLHITGIKDLILPSLNEMHRNSISKGDVGVQESTKINSPDNETGVHVETDSNSEAIQVDDDEFNQPNNDQALTNEPQETMDDQNDVLVTNKPPIVDANNDPHVSKGYNNEYNNETCEHIVARSNSPVQCSVENCIANNKTVEPDFLYSDLEDAHINNLSSSVYNDTNQAMFPETSENFNITTNCMFGQINIEFQDLNNDTITPTVEHLNVGNICINTQASSNPVNQIDSHNKDALEPPCILMEQEKAHPHTGIVIKRLEHLQQPSVEVTQNPGLSIKYSSPESPLYFLSNRGSLQLTLNRFLYYLHFSSGGGQKKRWRCIDYRSSSCKAYVDSVGELIVSRKFAHTHPFHDKQIMKKTSEKAIFMSISDVNKAAAESNKSMESEAMPEVTKRRKRIMLRKNNDN